MVLLTTYQSFKVAITSRNEMKKSVNNFSRKRETPVEIDWSHRHQNLKRDKGNTLQCCGAACIEDDSCGILATRWIALHKSISFISALVYELYSLWKAEGAKFFAKQGAFNSHYAVTMFLENSEYRVFIVYLVVYLTIHPDVCKASRIDRETFLAKFKEAESFKSVLEAVTIDHLAEIAPLIIKYFKIANHLTEKVKWTFFRETFSLQDLEDFWGNEEDDMDLPDDTDLPDETLNLTKFKSEDTNKGKSFDHSQKRSWLNPNFESKHLDAEDTTLVDMMRNDVENLCEFMLRRSFFEYMGHTKFNSYTAAICCIKDGMEKNYLDFFKRFHEKSNALINESDKDTLVEEIHRIKRRTLVCSQRLDQMHAHVKAQHTQIVTDLEAVPNQHQERRSHFTSCNQTWLPHLPRVCDGSAVEKALLSFLFQILLYIVAICVNGEDPDDEIMYLLVYVAIFFTVIYGFELALSEFIINSAIEFRTERSLLINLLIAFNMVANVAVPALLPFAATKILRNSSTLIDCILNSVAILFIVELDDLLISDLDIHILGDKVLHSYIGIMHELGEYKNKKKCTQYLCLESAIICVITFFTLASTIASLSYFLKME